MGCSGSRILDKDGKPIIKHKHNPNREKAMNKYKTIMEKIEALARSDEDIIISSPSYIESFRGYFNTYRELFEKHKISEDELYEGSQWYNIRLAFDTEYLDMYELFEDAFRGLYNTDDYERKDKLIDAFRNKLSEIKNYSRKQKGIPIEADNYKLEKTLEFIQFDKRTQDLEAIAIILKESQANNPIIINGIAETLKYMNNITSIAIVINNEDDKKEEITLNHFSAIFKAIAVNVRIKAFVIISSFHIIKLCDKTKHTIIDMMWKNEFLTLFGLSKIDLDEKTYKHILKICSTHKNIKAIGFDFKGKFNENYFNLFFDTIKTSKNLIIGCFYNGDDLKENELKQNKADEIKDKFISINTSLILS